MINPSDFNPRVVNFFEASRQVILEQHGSVEITDDEITYSIESDGELFLLSRQERAEKPRQIMRATSLDDIERYLVDEIGDDYRQQRGFSSIWLPWDEDLLERGFIMDDIGDDWFSLTDPSRKGWRVEIEIAGINDVACFSHIAKTTLDDLVSSYESSDGSPALQQFLHTD